MSRRSEDDERVAQDRAYCCSTALRRDGIHAGAERLGEPRVDAISSCMTLGHKRETSGVVGTPEDDGCRQWMEARLKRVDKSRRWRRLRPAFVTALASAPVEMLAEMDELCRCTTHLEHDEQHAIAWEPRAQLHGSAYRRPETARVRLGGDYRQRPANSRRGQYLLQASVFRTGLTTRTDRYAWADRQEGADGVLRA